MDGTKAPLLDSRRRGAKYSRLPRLVAKYFPVVCHGSFSYIHIRVILCRRRNGSIRGKYYCLLLILHFSYDL